MQPSKKLTKKEARLADDVYAQVMESLERERTRDRERARWSPLRFLRRCVRFLCTWFVFACGGGAIYMLGEGALVHSWPEINAGAVLLFVFLYMVRRL